MKTLAMPLTLESEFALTHYKIHSTVFQMTRGRRPGRWLLIQSRHSGGLQGPHPTGTIVEIRETLVLKNIDEPERADF